MAQKRMFDRAIIDTDKFMDLPMSAKAIYFLLGMEADDEGFVSYKKVIRIHGGNEDDIKILAAKEFLIVFKSGVVVITDWHTNNYLDSRRLKPTQYQLEKSKITFVCTDKKEGFKNNGRYLLSTGLAPAQPEESRVEESRVEESRVEEIATKVAKEFSLQEEIKKLEDSPRRDLNIIAMYLEERKPDIRNKEQLSVAIKRHLRPAKQLTSFTDNQLLDALPKAKKATEEFTLETIIKVLCK